MINIQSPRAGLVAKGFVVVGLVFLLGQIFSFSWLSALWPLFVILSGLPFLYLSRRLSSPSFTSFIYPGLIITGTGLLLLFQSLTGHWQSWAYAWLLYPALVGVAMQHEGKVRDNRGQRRSGRWMTNASLVGFFGLAVLFELFVFSNLFGGLFGWLWPLALIGIGVMMLSRRGELKVPSAASLGTVLRREKPAAAKRVATPERAEQTTAAEPAPRRRGTIGSDEPSAEIDPDLSRRIQEALGEDFTETPNRD
jgi:hypothetical protein